MFFYFLIFPLDFCQQILEQRIDVFINTAENICNNNAEAKPFVQHSVNELQKYWNDFKRQASISRQNVEDANKFFEIKDQVSHSGLMKKIK